MSGRDFQHKILSLHSQINNLTTLEEKGNIFSEVIKNQRTCMKFQYKHKNNLTEDTAAVK